MQPFGLDQSDQSKVMEDDVDSIVNFSHLGRRILESI